MASVIAELLPFDYLHFNDSLGGGGMKKESKVANRDWVDHQVCSLLQSINVIANLFIMGNYLN